MSTANPSAVHFTVDPTEFVKRLRPGDVVLFDSMRPVSHMIKLAENSPVNHAAVYAGNGEIFHATVPHRPGEGAVTRVSLPKRLSSGTHRTVTALRHDRAVSGEIDTADIVQEAQLMAAQGGRYARIDLISLIIPTFWRTYHRYFAGASPLDQSVRDILGYLTRNVLADIELAADSGQTAPELAPATLTVTCSEMVYLCYDRTSKGCLHIEQPLSRWAKDLPQQSELSPRINEVVASVAEWLSFYPPVLSDTRLQDVSVIGPTTMPVEGIAPTEREAMGLHFTGDEMGSLLERAKRVFTNQAVHNLSLGKYGPDRPDADSPLADMVTPGDLWRSPSLAAHTVFHLPPSYPVPRSDAAGDEN